MIEKLTIDMLTKDNVSVKKQQYIEQNGQQYTIGKPHRKAYINSVRGREDVINELPQEHQNAIFSIWGDAPIITE